MSNIVINPYSDLYKDQVIQLYLDIQNKEFSLPITIKDRPDLLQIPNVYQTSDSNFWVALDNNRVVGTIALLVIGNQQCALKYMYVDKNYRGKEKGVAKALLNQIMTWCVIKELREIYLFTNVVFLAAHRFYEKHGFTEIQQSDLPEAFPVLKIQARFYMYRFGNGKNIK
jgi:N-acetylglutamate synthase-like GNAT family acetyltransferase